MDETFRCCCSCPQGVVSSQAATRLKKAGTGPKKQAGNVNGTKWIKQEEHVATNQVSGQQVSNITGLKKSTLEKQSLTKKDGQRFNSAKNCI